jgi:hypothetical protein
LEKRRLLLNLKDRQRAHGEAIAKISDDLDVARRFMKKIEDTWVDAREAANHL